MAAGAAPAPMVVGALGGACLVAAAWLGNRPRWRSWALVVAGTVPFAALAWMSIVPLLLTVEAFVIAAVAPGRGAIQKPRADLSGGW